VNIFGPVTDNQLEQIKGMTYSVSQFLGEELPAHLQLYYIVIYLAPGDYHRIHSPAEFLVNQRIHFSGELYPVLPKVAQYIPSLFCLNERVVLKGTWDHGSFYLAPVGATNVGSIKLVHEPDFLTNAVGSQPNNVSRRDESPPWSVHKGDEVAAFDLGSTVVIIFEAPSFEFSVNVGDPIKVGESIGHIANLNNKIL